METAVRGNAPIQTQVVSKINLSCYLIQVPADPHIHASTKCYVGTLHTKDLRSTMLESSKNMKRKKVKAQSLLLLPMPCPAEKAEFPRKKFSS